MMDKTWMYKDRRSKEYADGVKQFINYATSNTDNPTQIKCPCERCSNFYMHTTREVQNHLFINGIDQGYTMWKWHGEKVIGRKRPLSTTEGDQYKCWSPIQNVTTPEDYNADDTTDMVHNAYNLCEGDTSKLEDLLLEGEKPLYPGCSKYNKLSALVRLWNLKAMGGWSDKSFSELLKLLRDMLPEENQIPPSMHQAKKTLNALGMEYEKIHACPNDCILYRHEFSNADKCPTCGASRWKAKKDGMIKSKVAAKVLWYFSPIPRFKRMYNSEETSKHLVWHHEERPNDGKLRHPADSPAWKLVDHKWPQFAAKPQNLRLAISADGINPYGNLSSMYSCWPVLMVNYNLPPWLCMKRKYMMLTMLISGPKQPGNDIDVYLAPLVEDLKKLWEVGVEVYDAYQKTKFTLKAALLWTINDFPAYGILCGCSVKGYKACPICGEETDSIRLQNGRKTAYTGSRRFLKPDDPLRKEKKAFNNDTEHRLKPRQLNGKEIFRKVEGIQNRWGKLNVSKSNSRKETSGDAVSSAVDDRDTVPYWKKKSIFFDLEYWKDLLVRHNLDVMHIEKNVCESLIGTLLNIPGKTKDGIQSRLDLVAMGIRKELAPQIDDKKTYLPPAPYTLSRKEKILVCDTLARIRVPDEYSSNISNCVSMKELKLFGLKSHDCHVLMQQLLPVALRPVLQERKHLRYTIVRLCFFFNALCSKVIIVEELNELQNEIVTTLCLLEKYFPPSFFDIMVHLMIHLVKEVQLCGPVHFRWMFPFERYNKVLKRSIRNLNRPEGCIAESYIAEEAIEVCAEYLPDLKGIGVPSAKNTPSDDTNQIYEEIIYDGRPLYIGDVLTIDDRQVLEQAHRWVLANFEEVLPYIEKHKVHIKEKNPRQAKNVKWLEAEHNQNFIYWLQAEVKKDYEGGNVSETLRWLSKGPEYDVITCGGNIVNGCQYFTKSRDNGRVNQNCGVSLVADTMQVASSKDQNPARGDMVHYGVIVDIWLLNYHLFKVPLFKCDWVDSRHVKVDEFGFTIVHLGKSGPTSEPFIIPSQAKQVFYIEDQLDPNHSIVLSAPSRAYPEDQDEITDMCCEREPSPLRFSSPKSYDIPDDSNLVRDNCDGITIIHKHK